MTGCAKDRLRIALVVAAAENNVIGRNGDLPWRMSGDLKWFKQVTMGKPIIMGRKTFESIGKPLPGRTNIVVTRRTDFDVDGAEVFASLDAAIDRARDVAIGDGVDEICVIGGAEIYRETLAIADRLYLTRIAATPEGDAYFPSLDAAEWRVERVGGLSPDEKNNFAADFLIMDRL
ncbi:MAG: dihydrofolate reductase [Pseudomonadota bacterium]